MDTSTSPIQCCVFLYPFKRQPHKMVKHNQTIRRLLLTTGFRVSILGEAL